MQQSPLIALPRKTTDETDWSAPIRRTIHTSYGEDPDTYAEECASLQRARQDAVRGAGSELTGRDLLFKYFGQLELLELRFPEIKVPFPWYDAFTGKLTTQTSLAFEKACVLFQLAATLATLAQQQTRASPEGVKRAYQHARTAAGLLVYINENFLHAPTTDLSKEVVRFLVGIVSAQAQEVFFEKVAEEGKGKKGGNAGLVARLASQAAFLYHALGEEVKEFFGKGIIDRNWVSLINIKAKYFTSLAQYYRAIADESASKYGDGVARLNIAEATAKEAQKLAATFNATFAPLNSPTLPADAGPAIAELTKAHLALVTELKTSANRDNDLIYHAIVPSETSLPQVDKFAAAAPMPIQEIYASPEVSKLIGPDIFQRLIPLSVHELSSVYSEEKAKLARAEADRSDEAESEVQASLASMNLPAGLHRYRAMLASRGAPDGHSAGLDALAVPGGETARWCEEVQEDEKIGKSLAKLLERLDACRTRVTEDLDWAQTELDKESRECESMRAQHQGNWAQLPSATAAKAQRDDLRSQRNSLSSAAQSDARCLALYETIKDDVAHLRSVEALEAAFAEAAAGAGSGAKQTSLLDLDVATEENNEREIENAKKLVGNIEERLGRLQRLKRERAETLKDLKELVQTDDPSHLLLVNRRNRNIEPSLFDTELEKYVPYQSRLSTAIDHEHATLGELARLLETLSSQKGARETQAKWDGAERRIKELNTRLGRTMTDYQEVKRGLAHGLEFYQQLQSLAEATRRSVKSFVVQRAEERSQLARQGATNSQSRSPPPSLSGSGGLESQFASLSMARAPQSPVGHYTSTSSPPPASYSPISAAYSPPPPQVPAQPQRAASSDPWDFAAAGGLSAFQTGPPPPAPPSHSSAPTNPYNSAGQSPAYPAFPQSTRQGSYPPPPPPPSSSSAYPSPYGPTSSVHPAPPPPPQTKAGGYSSAGSSPYSAYPPPPPPLSATASAYFSSAYPPPPQQPSYPPYGQQQQSAYPSSAYPAPPPPLPPSQGYSSPYGAYGGAPPPPQPPQSPYGGYR